jgi:hypothetical protein
MIPTVVEGNSFTGYIKVTSAWDGIPRKDDMSAIKSSRTCGELAPLLLVTSAFSPTDTESQNSKINISSQFIGLHQRTPY